MTNTNSSTNPDRRTFLSRAAGVAAGSAVLIGAATMTGPAIASHGGPDPIFAMIAMHKKLRAEWQQPYLQLDQAEFDAAKEHGNRPIELIQWRKHHIGASEIDKCRETLLKAGEIDPATVEQEYLDAKARYQAKITAGLAWDERTGLATLRKDVDRRTASQWHCEKRLAHTKPTTPAGAAALIQYVLDDDLVDDESYWHMAALRSAVAALNSMSAAPV
jgi:hypothetical protein